MIYPTRLAVLIVAAGAPVGLVLGMVRPDLWTAGLAWIAGAAFLMLADALLSAPGRSLDLRITTPPQIYMGRAAEARVDAGFAGALKPRNVEVAMSVNEKLTLAGDRGWTPVVGEGAGMRFSLEPLRRGVGQLNSVWLRWRGPLGLVWRQRLERAERDIPIIPNIAAVKDEAIRLFSRQASFGMKMQRDTGEGAEFHALRDFQTGMDRRAVDWKQSARHVKLLAKEHHTERNHHIILTIDCGRTMSEPLAGQPRLDRAINAALMMAFISLKLGDKVGLFAFDSHVRASTGVVSGVRGFTALQHVASGVDFSTEETNFTLGLSTLSGQLERRSLIVIFTDFTDSIGAELMIENTQRLLKRHIVLFVAMRDVELEQLARAEPESPRDVSRAVTAGALLREREAVLQRLRHMGVEVLDAPLEQIGPELVSAYLALKQRNVL